MTKIRPRQKGKYDMDKHEFYTAYHYALQYERWKDRYAALENTLQGIAYDKDRVIASPNPDGLLRVAAERMELADKIRMVDETVNKVAPDIAPYLLRGVTRDGASYTYLREVMRIPCGKDYYYQKRREFYYRIAKKIR